MSDFTDELARVAELRRERDRADERLRAKRRRLTSVTAELDAVRRRGPAEARNAARLERERAQLTADIEQDTRRLSERARSLATSLDRFTSLGDPTRLIEQWDDHIPILLLPVRVETRFMPVVAPRELWVRIFPDDIAIHTHESDLTSGEITAGNQYWEEVSAAASLSEGERRAKERAAWQALAGTTEGPRAAWIVAQTRPTLISSEEQAGRDFWAAFEAAAGSPDAEDAAWHTLADRHGPARARLIATRTAPTAEAAEAIVRRQDEAAPGTWSRAPRTKVMPDRFAVILQRAGVPDRTELGVQVPDPLVLGPDPSAQELDIDRVNGELRLSDDIRWMRDFDEALRVGMAVKVPLSEQEAAAGFDRLFVLGLRLSASAGESRTLVERLIDNHHYSPDGAGLIPQGTPTNNTSDAGSGFRSSTTDVSESEAVEAGDPLFTPVDDVAARTDAQWLAEALGVEYGPLEHLQHADVEDVRETRLMNQALWHATLGYYLEQMLAIAPAAVRDVERFFVDHVSGRGPLPAIRVGTQPYGVLVTSDTRRWRDEPVRGRPSVAQQLRSLITAVEGIWEAALASVSVAGKPGDSHALLLDILGLQATSVDYFRRHAVGSEYLWNYGAFRGWGAAAAEARRVQTELGVQLLEGVGQPAQTPRPLLDLTFFTGHSHITDPLVSDVPSIEEERFSETEGVRRLYKLADADALQNYLGWLHASSVADIRAQSFVGANGESLPVPRSLLYRLLRHALLLANVDAVLQLYEANGVVSPLARREVELPNVRADRTVTRWELMEARVDRVLPQLSDRPLQVVEYLGSDEGRTQPSVSGLIRVRAALEELVDLPTARLERLFAEHVDLCSYRLDGWQTALFTERLRGLRDPKRTGRFADRALGVHLGAFGWLEEVRPGVVAVPVDPERVPEALRDPGAGIIVEQPDSGGAVHGLSTTHAVAAAVMRNAYLTHASPGNREVMSIDLSSERARLATYYLEGIANGQSLGALLGYQFQRGLKERHGDPSLAQFSLNFRDAYPIRADKITPDVGGNDTTLKEANSVFDGYALLERTLLATPPLGYPYGVEGLPAAGSAQASAIQNEVERMAATMDAVGDLALAEGVYQVAQGNYDRGGATVQAISRGAQLPEPEILRTPRSGAAINHRVSLHLEPDAPSSFWSSTPSPRSTAEPALNAWLGERLGDPATVRYVVRHGPAGIEDADNSLGGLDIEPIDLIHIIGDEVTDGDSELVRRIRHAYRVTHGGAGASEVQQLAVEFPARHPQWGENDRSLFEVMPLIASLKRLATHARPLGASDYMLPSEENTNPTVDPNPQRFDATGMDARLAGPLTELTALRDQLALAIVGASALQLETATPGERVAALTSLIDATRDLAPFGFADAFADGRAAPLHTGDAPTAFQRALAHHLDVGSSVQRQADARLAEARRLKDFTDLDAAEAVALTVTQKVERYREAARQLLGSDFNFLPRFTLKNPDELSAALAFRELPVEGGLLRHSADPMIVEEWFQGAAAVRERLQTLATLATMGDAFAIPFPALRPLQLPFRASDYWVAVQYPDVPTPESDDEDTTLFRPVGDFLSVVQVLPTSGFHPGARQTGLLLDAWSEVIPNRAETTGIAVHYNQPSAQAPQVLLLAVTPELTGAWSWNDLVGVLGDTLRRAKLRAVEPDQIQASALGHFLPAILTPVSSRPGATVTADLVHQSAVAFGGP
jgi:hypothetical protein